MSDSSRTQLRYLVETTWGDIPASAMKELRMTGESLNFEISNVTSSEIRSDRQTTDLIQTSFQNGGGFNYEMSLTTYDDFVESALFSNFAVLIDFTATDISFDANDNSINTVGGDFVAEGLSDGDWFKVTGSGSNNGVYKAVSVSTSKVIVTGANPIQNESAGATVTLFASHIKNGTTEKSFTLEKEFSDIGQFIHYTGMIVNTWSMSVSAQSIITGSFEFVGKNSDITQSSVGTGQPTSATTTEVVDAGTSVGIIREGSTTIAEGLIQSLNFNLNNNLRGQPAVAVIGNADVSAGTLGIEGTVNVYFKDETLYQKYVNGTETSIEFSIEDVDGNLFIVSFPRVKFGAAPVNAGGINQDVISAMTFTAIRDPNTDSMIRIFKA